MKTTIKIIMLFGIIFPLISAMAQEKNDILQRKSVLFERSGFGQKSTSYPFPFDFYGEPIKNAKDSAAITTGYYFVHSNDKAEYPWRPEVIIADTNDDPNNWHRIISGPNQKTMAYWNSHPELGYGFFRNPDLLSDSTDNAIAGPIPIGFKFKFNGIEYDSFYVSSNGCIALSNSRYFYDFSNHRQIRNNNYASPSCYNYMSMDWFRRGVFKGNGLNDSIPDNYGWYSVTGGEFAGSLGGIRNPKKSPEALSRETGAALIAPFYGDMYLSQYNADSLKPRDRGRVYYYRNATKLMIYFVDIQLKDTIKFPNNEFRVINFPDSLTPAENKYVGLCAVVTLDNSDNSINLTCERFRGRIDHQIYLFPAKLLIRMNTICGLFGFARHQDYDSKLAKTTPGYKGTLPWAKEYFQGTYCWDHTYAGNNEYIGYPEDTQAIKFMQWKNTLMVCDLSFRVRKQKESETDFTEKVLSTKADNYEILAGHPQIGMLQPVAIVRNLTNDIQGQDGINYQPNDLSFRVKCDIINEATRQIIYSRIIVVDSLAIAKKATENAYEKVILSKVNFTGTDFETDTMHSDYYDSQNRLKSKWNGIPPYGFVEVYFPPFIPDEKVLSNIGLMKCIITADPTDPKLKKGYQDKWPFDDTLSKNIWVMRQIKNDKPFFDDATEFHVVCDEDGTPYPVPSVYNWVSIGAQVVSGDNVSRYPLPPRGDYLCNNKNIFPTYKISSPTIELKRPMVNKVNFGEWGKSEIRSFPIDMLYKNLSAISVSVQRTRNRDNWGRGWSDQMLIGCEHRVVSSDWYNEVQQPDVLNIEFAKSSPNWKDGTGITNIPEANWRYHPRRGGAPPETRMPAYQLFGGGGHLIGFLESDRDSAMAPPNYSPSKRLTNGLRYDYYDDGIDLEYNSIIIPIPDTFINAANQGAKYFRFRIQNYSRNNQLSSTTIPDDDDPFYVDNIVIMNSLIECCIDVSVYSVKVESPYTMIPASQATSLPVKIRLLNNSPKQSGAFWTKTYIFRQTDFDQSYFLDDAWIWRGDPNNDEMIELFKKKNMDSRDSARWLLFNKKAVYCKSKQLPYLRPGANEVVSMPEFNARENPPGNYVVMGIANIPGGDENMSNDTNFSTFNIHFGPIMAYHPISNPNDFRRCTNDVEQIAQQYSRGLNLRGYHKGGTNNYSDSWAYGDVGGDGNAGEIAVSFDLIREDTIKGIGAYYCIKSLSPDYIKYHLYSGENYPQYELPNTMIDSKRGYDKLTDSYIYNILSVDLLAVKTVLEKGRYWISVNQLGETGLNLGASGSGVGMRCTNIYEHYYPDADSNGSKSYYINLEDKFRIKDKFGVSYNDNRFAYRNGLNEWVPFTPATGNPGYGHLNYQGISPVDKITKTYSRGSWMPLIVPYFGDRSFAEKANHINCYLGDPWPVELMNFKGFIRNGSVVLSWQTASEQNNSGFYVERRLTEDGENWKTHSGFIEGFGNSKIEHDYFFADTNVKVNTTYLYRLRQVDNDGTQSCDDFSNIVTLTYTENGEIALLPNSPNPFTYETEIKFILPEETRVSLEIFDIFGNRINTILNETMDAGSHSIFWNGINNSGTKVSSGTYIYRLRAGENSLSGKMIYIRE